MALKMFVFVFSILVVACADEHSKKTEEDKAPKKIFIETGLFASTSLLELFF